MPLQQDTVFQPLAGKHSKMVDDPDFRFVLHLVGGIGQYVQQCLFLFTSKGKTACIVFLFFAVFTPEYRRMKGIAIGTILGKRREDFPQPFDLAVVRINGQLTFPEPLRIGISQLRRHFMKILAAFRQRCQEVSQVGFIIEPFVYGRGGSAVRVLGISVPNLGKRQHVCRFDQIARVSDVRRNDLYAGCFQNRKQLFDFPLRFFLILGFQADRFSFTIDLIAIIVSSAWFLVDGADFLLHDFPRHCPVSS